MERNELEREKERKRERRLVRDHGRNIEDRMCRTERKAETAGR